MSKILKLLGGVKMEKEKDINFIKNFSSIKLSGILKKNKIDPSNFYKGKISEEKTKLIKDELDRNIINLYYDRMIKDES
jgi:hypothetical protein